MIHRALCIGVADGESLAMQVHLTLGAVRMAASAVRGVCELYANDEIGYQLEVVVAEIGNNIVLHGMGIMDDLLADAVFSLTVRTADDTIRLTFEDSGPQFDLSTAIPGTPEESIARGGGGLGIYIVRKVMDEITYEYTGGINRLCLMKKIDRSDGEDKDD